MKKIEKASELLWALGILFVACGVAICSKANLGLSMIPALSFVLFEAIGYLWPFLSVGVIDYLIQGVLLLLLCLSIQKFRWRYLLAFAVSVIYGYTLDLFLWIFRDVQIQQVWIRWVVLFVGEMISSFGIACFFRTYFPLRVFEFFVVEFASHFCINLNKAKMGFDVSILLVVLILAFTLFDDALTFNWLSIGKTGFHNIGLGTIVTTAINSPLIALHGKTIDRLFDNSARFSVLQKHLGN